MISVANLYRNHKYKTLSVTNFYFIVYKASLCGDWQFVNEPDKDFCAETMKATFDKTEICI